jgi:hypothetical protein
MDARVTPANKSCIAALGLKGRKPAKRTILIDVHRKLEYDLSKPRAVELYALSECGIWSP